ncbi:hypothetical protein PG993_005116 [Apiospora rasikravindrae]|uniref:Uncharacterized protein n=1 Tax=Apiospora rasikravindrae TaxID=990691 RepID=A0ABR1TEQ2_9PEZI
MSSNNISLVCEAPIGELGRLVEQIGRVHHDVHLPARGPTIRRIPITSHKSTPITTPRPTSPKPTWSRPTYLPTLSSERPPHSGKYGAQFPLYLDRTGGDEIDSIPEEGGFPRLALRTDLITKMDRVGRVLVE